MSGFTFAIRVKPGSSRTKVGGSYGDPSALIVSVSQQPIDGQANEAVISVLAKALNVRKSDLVVLSGHTARTKIIQCAVEKASIKVAELLAE